MKRQSSIPWAEAAAPGNQVSDHSSPLWMWTYDGVRPGNDHHVHLPLFHLLRNRTVHSLTSGLFIRSKSSDFYWLHFPVLVTESSAVDVKFSLPCSSSFRLPYRCEMSLLEFLGCCCCHQNLGCLFLPPVCFPLLRLLLDLRESRTSQAVGVCSFLSTLS